VTRVTETVDQLRAWLETKRLGGLTNAHIQMARELRMKPKRLRNLACASPMVLIQRIEALYHERFNKSRPDVVVPLRQLLREAEARERTEKRERKRARKQAEELAADATRAMVTNIQRMYGG